MRSELESENFGTMTLVEIGAFTVGSIRQCYQPGANVERADRKAVFGIGGSTVVVLFEPGTIRFDQDLVETFASISTLSKLTLTGLFTVDLIEESNMVWTWRYATPTTPKA